MVQTRPTHTHQWEAWAGSHNRLGDSSQSPLADTSPTEKKRWRNVKNVSREMRHTIDMLHTFDMQPFNKHWKQKRVVAVPSERCPCWWGCIVHGSARKASLLPALWGHSDWGCPPAPHLWNIEWRVELIREGKKPLICSDLKITHKSIIVNITVTSLHMLKISASQKYWIGRFSAGLEQTPATHYNSGSGLVTTEAI